MHSTSRIASRLVLLLTLLLSSVHAVVAQPGRRQPITCEGFILDSKTDEPLIQAAVKVTSADGGTGTFGISDNDGRFSFEIQRMGKYTLEFSYVGYKPLYKEVNIWPGRGANLGKFKLEEDPQVLGEVETVARSQRVKQVGDTIVYNADAYKVQEGATAEDLIAKMPGMEVTDEGVKAQGETVEKILVDGKSFFENDPKLALRTLPAEVVQTVAVFDKKSDQAEFTGFDDGNTVKAMDLTTKSYRRNGVFGRVYGSLGANTDFDNPYYNAGFNLNFFEGDRRISLLGMTNNVNQQDFSFDDLQASGGMGGRGGRWGNRRGSLDGVSRANAFGLNFNDTYLDDKLDVQGSYFFNGARATYENESQQDYINTPRASVSTTNRLSHNFSHRLDMRVRYRPSENDEFIFRPSLNFQKTDGLGTSQSQTWRLPLDSILAMSALQRADTSRMQNWTFNRSFSESHSWNVGGQLTWRHRFAKAGRTLSSVVSGRLSGSESEGNNIRTGSAVRKGDNFQNSASDQDNWSAGGNLQYTEPLGERTQLSLRYNLNYSRSDNERRVGYDDAFSSGAFDPYLIDFQRSMDSIDAANSSRYSTRNLRQGGEVAFRFRTETTNLKVGLDLESSKLEGEQHYDWWTTANGMDESRRPDYKTSHHYFSILPDLNFEWKPLQGSSIDINYRASTSNPSLSNLQETVNTTNELSYSTGNKDLDQSVNHSFRLRFIHSNMEKATNIMFFGALNLRKDYIGTEYITNNSDAGLALVDLGWVAGLSAKEREQYRDLVLRSGARISRPVNMGGYRSAMAGLTYGFPWDLIRSNVNLSLNTNYSLSPSRQVYYNNATDLTDVQDLSTKVRNFSLSPRVHVTSNISQDLDFSVEYSPSFQKVKDTQNEANNYDYISQRASARLNWTFWRGFTTEQHLQYNYWGGSSLTSTEDEWIWNASVGKKFLKGNKAEIKLQAYDILNGRSGYSQGVSDSYVSYSFSNFMPRYVLLTLTYRISNYKGSSEMRQRSGGPGRGPGGGFGPGPM